MVGVLQLYFEGETSLRLYAKLASNYVCHILPRNSMTSVSFTPGDYYPHNKKIILVFIKNMLFIFLLASSNNSMCNYVKWCRRTFICQGRGQYAICN